MSTKKTSPKLVIALLTPIHFTNPLTVGIHPLMNITEYIRALIQYDNPVLPKLEPQETTRADTRSFIEPEIAKLINIFIRSTNAQNVLELGTCVGYSGIWMAEALKKTNGMLTTIEYDLDLLKEAKNNFKKAGVETHIKILDGNIIDVIKKLPNESFDIIFQDAKKSLYSEMLEDCIRLLKKGGLIIADDTLYSRNGTAERIREPLKKYNELVFADNRLYSVILPVGEGLTISYKI